MCISARSDRVPDLEAAPEDDLSPAEKELLDTVRELGYPASEAAELIRQAAGLGSDGESIAGWINQIGAMTLRIQQLEADLEADLAAGTAT